MNAYQIITLAILCSVVGYLLGKHFGFRKGWAYCENYLVRKIGEEMDELERLKAKS